MAALFSLQLSPTAFSEHPTGASLAAHIAHATSMLTEQQRYAATQTTGSWQAAAGKPVSAVRALPAAVLMPLSEPCSCS